MSKPYDKETARLDILNQLYRVQPQDTGLVWTEVFARSKWDAIQIVISDERFIELHGYTLEAYLASMSLKELVNDFVNMQPLDELPDEAYKERFIVELERYFKHSKKEKS